MALTVNLPQHLQEFVSREVAAGRFASAEAAVIDAVEVAMGLDAPDPELTASLAEAGRGEASILTPDLRSEIRARAERQLREGHVVRNDVTY